MTEHHYHHDADNSASSASSLIVALVAILIIVALGLFALRTLGVGMPAEANTDDKVNVEVNLPYDTPAGTDASVD